MTVYRGALGSLGAAMKRPWRRRPRRWPRRRARRGSRRRRRGARASKFHFSTADAAGRAASGDAKRDVAEGDTRGDRRDDTCRRAGATARGVTPRASAGDGPAEWEPVPSASRQISRVFLLWFGRGRHGGRRGGSARGFAGAVGVRTLSGPSFVRTRAVESPRQPSRARHAVPPRANPPPKKTSNDGLPKIGETRGMVRPSAPNQPQKKSVPKQKKLEKILRKKFGRPLASHCKQHQRNGSHHRRTIRPGLGGRLRRLRAHDAPRSREDGERSLQGEVHADERLLDPRTVRFRRSHRVPSQKIPPPRLLTLACSSPPPSPSSTRSTPSSGLSSRTCPSSTPASPTTTSLRC